MVCVVVAAWFVGPACSEARRAARNPEPSEPEQSALNGMPDPGSRGTLFEAVVGLGRALVSPLLLLRLHAPPGSPAGGSDGAEPG